MDSKDKDIEPTKEMLAERHKLIRDIETRFDAFSLNTVISGFMEHNNNLMDIAKKEGGIDKETLRTFAVLLAPFAPHLAEEAWHDLGGTESVFKAGWPKYEEDMVKEDVLKIPVQVNGKVKTVLEIPADMAKDEVLSKAKEALEGRISGSIVKEIYVPGKIVNFVAK